MSARYGRTATTVTVSSQEPDQIHARVSNPPSKSDLMCDGGIDGLRECNAVAIGIFDHDDFDFV